MTDLKTEFSEAEEKAYWDFIEKAVEEFESWSPTKKALTALPLDYAFREAGLGPKR
ncbi:MAG: hypothetical protein KAR00_00880 [Candidatus Pacebacteria bacterium]|nr:hypothetical protein [Candidatus Paceibacterota bacterium]